MRGVFYRIGVAFDGIAGPNKALGEPESFEKVPILVHRSPRRVPRDGVVAAAG